MEWPRDVLYMDGDAGEAGGVLVVRVTMMGL